jgi:filamentous hemagglutinin family protein
VPPARAWRAILHCARRFAFALCISLLATNTNADAATLNLSQDLVSLGIAATNMVPNRPSLDAGPLLTQGVEYAKAHQIGQVVADPGSYYFLSRACTWCHVQLFGVNDITIDLQGAELVFTYPLQSGIYLAFSNNTTLQNFSVDYQPLPFTQVRVVSVDAAQATIQYAVEPGWQDPTAFNSAQVTPGLPDLFVTVHMFRNGQPVPGLGAMSAAYPLSAGVFTLTPWVFQPTPASLAKIRVGDIAVLTMRTTLGAIYTDRCAGCILRNIRVYAGPQNALDAHLSPSNTLERIYTMPRPATDRLVSTDGINFQAAGPNNAIRLNRAIRTMDDGFGLYNSITGTVQTQTGNRQLMVQGTANTTLGWLVSVPDGSAVTFQRRLDGAILGSAIVVSQSPVASTVTYNFDRDLPAGVVGSAMYPSDPNLRGAGSLIERNTTQFQSLLGTGIDIAGWAGSIVRGNYIHRTGLAGIQGIQSLEQNPDNWQTTPLTDMTFSNNVIDVANATPAPLLWWYDLGGLQTVTLRSDESGYYTFMPTSPHQNISMTGNFVAYPGRSAFRAGNISGGSVSGNILLRPNDRPDLADTPLTGDAVLPIVIDRSTGVTTANNAIDSTAGQVFVTDVQYRELAAYAPGSTLRLNAYNLGALSSPSIALTDADGNTSYPFVQNTTAHALDVQLPASAGLGGAFVTLSSGAAKYFGTLFIDSQDNIPALNGCTYELSPASPSAPDTGGSLPVLVVTQAGCSYSAADTDSFVTVGAGGIGTGVTSASLAANTGAARTTTLEIAAIPLTLYQAEVGSSGVPGMGSVVANPYGTLSVQGATLNGSTISNLQPNAIIQLGSIPGAPGSFAEIDFQGLGVGAGNTVTLRSGAPGQTIVLSNISSTPSSVAGVLQAQSGNGAAPPALMLRDPNGITVAAGGLVSTPAGLQVNTLGTTPLSGQAVTNAGMIDGGIALSLLAGAVHGGGSFRADTITLSTFGNANNPVNGSHFLSNGLQLYPTTGTDVGLILNDYGTAPQFLNVNVNGNTELWMPSSWPAGAPLPKNNAPIPFGGVRPPGTGEPPFGGGSMIVQATGNLMLHDDGVARDFAFTGGIVLKAGGTLNLNGVTVNQGWTTSGKAFQGIYFESPNITSASVVSILSNDLNWTNFSTPPSAHFKIWRLVQMPDGSAQYAAADSTAPHQNTYSVLVEAAANGQCWTCLVNYTPINAQ